jgi:hypothetical protein
MARRPANKGKTCVRYKMTAAGRRCAKFGTKRKSAPKRKRRR